MKTLLLSQYLSNDYIVELNPENDPSFNIAREASRIAKRHGFELRGPEPGQVGENMLYLRRPEMPTRVETR